MLVLFESASGYAIFKVLKEKKLKKADNLYKEFESPDKASKLLQLKHFEKFDDMKDALKVTTAAIEGKLSKKLKKLLKKVVVGEVQEQLAVADAKLGTAITKKFNIECISSNPIQELMRCIRGNMENLIDGFPAAKEAAMALGLAHSLSRYKLKFSPDKIDTMVIQAINLLDDLDKELNNYMMRCREWYGWHFPELAKVVTDSQVYVKAILAIGLRANIAQSNLSDVLPEEVEEQVRSLAEISMGTEISEEDLSNIKDLCQEVVELQNYRTQLYDYLKNRMMAIAPNLTILVGEMVGARLVSHAGSLMNLAKHPASTVQILGAEKALFRAIKNKQDTPKFGLLYHAAMVGQANTAIKGKVSRMLAAKAALACRVDALGEDDITSTTLGLESKAKLELRLKALEEGKLNRVSGTGKAKMKREKYDNKSKVLQYKDAGDSLIDTKPSVSKKRKFIPDEPTPKIKKMKVEEEVKEEKDEVEDDNVEEDDDDEEEEGDE